MFPKTLKGLIFVFLTFINVTIASFFVASGNQEQFLMSSLTSVFCFIVWLTELPANKT